MLWPAGNDVGELEQMLGGHRQVGAEPGECRGGAVGVGVDEPERGRLCGLSQPEQAVDQFGGQGVGAVDDEVLDPVSDRPGPGAVPPVATVVYRAAVEVFAERGEDGQGQIGRAARSRCGPHHEHAAAHIVDAGE